MRRGQLVRRRNKIDHAIGIIEERNGLLETIVELRGEIATESGTIDALTAQRAALLGELEQVKSKLSQCQASGKALQADLSDARAQTREEKHERSLAEALVRQLREENAKYREQLGLAAEKVEEKAALEGDLKTQLAESEVRVEELLDDLERTEAELDAVTNQREAAREECGATRAELEASKAQVSTLTARSNAAEKHGQGLEAKLKLAQNQLQLVRMKLDQQAGRGRQQTGAGWAPRMTAFGASQQKAAFGKVNVGKLDKDLKLDQKDINDALEDRIVIMTGWLEKRKKGVNNWKKRWCVRQGYQAAADALSEVGADLFCQNDPWFPLVTVASQ
eukprot:SAG22_NODE_2098_length_3017_cov_1.332077_4_plen_335_part_00